MNVFGAAERKAIVTTERGCTPMTISRRLADPPVDRRASFRAIAPCCNCALLLALWFSPSIVTVAAVVCRISFHPVQVLARPLPAQRLVIPVLTIVVLYVTPCPILVWSTHTDKRIHSVFARCTVLAGIRIALVVFVARLFVPHAICAASCCSRWGVAGLARKRTHTSRGSSITRISGGRVVDQWAFCTRLFFFVDIPAFVLILLSIPDRRWMSE